jgi:hypothetical protein
MGGSASASIDEDCPLSPSSADAAAAAAASSAQQQRVVDCLDTLRYLAMDESARMALIDLGAIELLLTKLQASCNSSSCCTSSSRSRSADRAAPSPAVLEAVLCVLPSLARHDVTKLRVWDNPHSGALLQLLGGRHASPLARAAHLCVAQLGWSCELGEHGSGSGSSGFHTSCSSIFDSVSGHVGRDDAASNASSAGSCVLLSPALVPALAAGLHPAADVPVLLSLLRLLCKAVGSSCLASPSASTPTSAGSGAPGGVSSGELCAVQLQAQSAAWRVGWQQAIFALPPLLCAAQQQPGAPPQPQHGCGSGSGGRHAVVACALELLVGLAEQHPEFHALVCAAGCLPPLLGLLLHASRDASLQAACALAALLDCPAALQLLSHQASLLALLRVLDDSSRSTDVRLAVLHALRRLAGASEGCAAQLKQLGGGAVVVALLQQVGDSEVRRGAAVLLQLLGKQVVVRPPRQQQQPQHRGSAGGGGGGSTSSSSRSSFESDTLAGVRGALA